MRNLSVLLSASLFFVACNSAVPKKQAVTVPYFDVKGYIYAEAGRLQRANPEISKTVMVNNDSEHKKVKIADWKKELSAFSDADINKSAWKDLFKLQKQKDMEVYTSGNEKVPVKSLSIFYRNGKVQGIKLLISNANLLYTSNDTLSYYPDSLYQVKKTQRIKFLKEKNYRINGQF